jgi:hypothetical protein
VRVGCLLALAVMALAGRAQAQGILDFITFDGVHYLRWAEEPGRPLTRADLSIEFATVDCSYGEDRSGCAFGRDAAAAFMPAGTRVYAVRGYRTEFRLAAVVGDRVFLYQVWRNPRAKVGGDLFDVLGKVRAIDVQRGGPLPPGAGQAARVTTKDADALVDMLVRAPVRAPRAYTFGEPRYWLTLWLADGTTLVRPYLPESSEVMDGVALPPGFGSILERYLRD